VQGEGKGSDGNKVRSAVQRWLCEEGTLRWIFLSILLCVLGVLVGKTGLADDQRPTANGQKEDVITRADLPGFQVIGIEARTTNAREATADGVIPRQWKKFYQEGIMAKIPNAIGSNIHALYTDYAGDRNGEYSFVIGAMVKDGTAAPAGMVAKSVPGGRFAVLTSDKGPLSKVVPGAWQRIWKLEDEKKLQRIYKTDFEIYDQRSQDPQNAQVDLYVGMK
jgi:predicted transcriptional regulator YdeE